jgi:hypothetical protein
MPKSMRLSGIALLLLTAVIPLAQGQFGNLLNTAKKAVEDASTAVRETYREAERRVDSPTLNQITRSVQEYASEYGETAANELQKVADSWGNEAVTAVKRVAASYGAQASQELSNAYNKWGKEPGDIIADVYNRFGKQSAETLIRIFDAEGSVMAIGIAKLGSYAEAKLINIYSIYGSSALRSIYAVYRECGDELGALVAKVAMQINDIISTPAKRQQVVDKTAAVVQFIHKVNTDRKGLVAEALKTTAETVQIRDKSGNNVTLEGYCRRWIREQAPYLSGTQLERDPIGAFSTVIIFNDLSYISSELAIIRSDNGTYMTIEEAAIDSSPFSAKNTENVLECASAFETFTDDSFDEKDIIEATRIIQVVNR